MQVSPLSLSIFIAESPSFHHQDSRNIARVIIELARRGVRLMPNTQIRPGRRWPWMGKSGQILEQYCLM
jgi:hypothetical protein